MSKGKSKKKSGKAKPEIETQVAAPAVDEVVVGAEDVVADAHAADPETHVEAEAADPAATTAPEDKAETPASADLAEPSAAADWTPVADLTVGEIVDAAEVVAASEAEAVTEAQTEPLQTLEAPPVPEAPKRKMAARRPRGSRRQLPDPAQEVLPDVVPQEIPEPTPSVEDLATWHGFDPETTVDLRNAPEIFAPMRDDAAPPPTEPPPDGASVNHHLRGLLEALIFASDKAIKTADLARSAKAQIKEVRDVLAELRAHYATRGIVLDEVAGGWLFRTSVVYAPFVRDLTGQKPVKLTRAQLETLAILAYRQPITRPEIDEIRGVDSGPVLKMLLERDFIRILGKKDEVGRPILYGTTPAFLEFFNLKSLKDMPTLKEFTELNDESRVIAERELGEPFDAATERALAQQAIEHEGSAAESGLGEGEEEAAEAEEAAEVAEAAFLAEGASDAATEWSSPIEASDPEADAAADEAEKSEAGPEDADDADDAEPVTLASANKILVEDDDDIDLDEPTTRAHVEKRSDPDDDADEDADDSVADDDASKPKVSPADEEEFPDDDDSEFEDDDDDDWSDDDDDDADDDDDGESEDVDEADKAEENDDAAVAPNVAGEEDGEHKVSTSDEPDE